MRKWLGGALIAFWSLPAFLAACRDDAREPLRNTDAGPADIVVSNLAVHLGGPALLDASQTDASEFTWAVKTVPNGSGVSTSSLVGPTTSRPSFVPDLAGEYILDVTVRVRGVTVTKSVAVKAVAAPLFFMQATVEDGGTRTVEYRTVGNDRSNNRPIACPIERQSEAITFAFADVGMDWWEAPAGSSSRVAFASGQPLPDGGIKTFLALGSSDTSCEAPPTVIEHVDVGSGNADGGSFAPLVHPRFSPDGARVAFVDNLADGYSVETVGHDGAGRRILGRFCDEHFANGCWSSGKFPPRPQWLDAHTVGWARAHWSNGASGWEIVLADDSDTPNLRVYMTCTGGAPRSIAFLKDESVVANPLNDEVEDLVLFRPNNGACQVVRNFTNLPNKNSYARDFAVSPDQSEIVFLRRGTLAGEPLPDGGEPRYGGMLYAVPTNGSLPPAPFTGSPEYAVFGARYVASANEIAWNGYSPDDAGIPKEGARFPLPPAMKVATRDGRTPRAVVVSDPDAGTYVLGGGNGGSLDGCAFVPAQPSGTGVSAAVAAVLACAASAARRRGRRSTGELRE